MCRYWKIQVTCSFYRSYDLEVHGLAMAMRFLIMTLLRFTTGQISFRTRISLYYTPILSFNIGECRLKDLENESLMVANDVISSIFKVCYPETLS